MKDGLSGAEMFLVRIGDEEREACLDALTEHHVRGQLSAEESTGGSEMEAEANGTLAECGRPSRPVGRLWLLQPPPGHPSLELTLSALLASAAHAGVEARLTTEFVEHVRRELDAMFDGEPGPDQL